MYKNLTTVFLLCIAATGHTQYLETFSTPNKGYLLNQLNDFSGVNWTLGSWANQPPAAFGRDIADYFQTTAAGTLENLDLDQEVCWESPMINTAAAPTVSLAVDLGWEGFDADIAGDPCTEASLDYIKVQYSIDGGAYTTVPNVAGGSACATVGYVSGAPNPPFSGNTTVMQAGIAGGSTLRIRVCANTNTNPEIVRIDNVSVPEAGVTLGCTAPTLSTASTPITCGGPNSGAIDLTVSGGTPGYTYAWSNGDPGQDQANLTEGIYTVTVTDAANCTATATATVGTAPFSVSTHVGPATCAGLPDGEIDLGVSGGIPPYSYSWADLPGANDPQDRTGLTVGTYAVTITDSGVCSATAGATVGVTPAGPYLETFSTDGKGLLSGSACNGLNATTCTANNFAGANWSIYGLAALLGIEPDDYFSTSGGALQGKDFDQVICWESPLVDIDPPGTGAAFSVDLGWAGFDQEPPGPDPLDGVADHIDVEYSTDGGAWTRVPNQTGGGLTNHTIVYLNGSGTNLGGTTTVTATGIGGSTLRIRVCGYLNADAETMSIDNVSVPGSTGLYCPLPEIGATVSDAKCNGSSDGAINLSVSGGAPGYTYKWSNGAVTEDLSGIPAGAYTVTVTDQAGYTVVAMLNVGEPAPLLLSASVAKPISCIGDADGALEVLIDGGQPLYTINWSSGANANPATGLGAGAYTVSVSDAFGCSAVLQNIVLTDPPPLFVDYIPFGEVCADGGVWPLSLDTIFGGAGGPYQFNVDKGVYVGADFPIPVGAGLHEVGFIDRLGCLTIDSIYIATLPPSQLTISQPDTACLNLPGLYSLQDSLGSYQWVAANNGLITQGQGTNAVTVVWSTPGATTLSVYFTNANGCADTAILNLTVKVCVGTKDLALPGVQVWPNPFGAGLTVAFGRPVQPDARLRLLDAGGKVVAEQALVQETTWLETAGLPAGVYGVQVVESGRLGVWMVVKVE